ncbi:phage protein [Candidatus Sodalis pierantonius str. SOPE]|uniref:Phage protein n=1 Tax=Candidatus Sodalis pierantonii str. SOPE TaxID=2342 RepID=W0HIT9_9GAMM|nr:hypothetical protein [Candidatus Sodalis pierantonius]AHF73674.1 phage protein [Candidatus Sodalis pierantonius str. SOPE]
MKSFNVKQVEKFRDVFPELTTIEQLETAMLFSLGLSKKEIAAARDVVYITVEKMLDAIKSKFNLYSLNNLLSVFQVRLVFFALTGGTVKNKK